MRAYAVYQRYLYAEVLRAVFVRKIDAENIASRWNCVVREIDPAKIDWSRATG